MASSDEEDFPVDDYDEGELEAARQQGRAEEDLDEKFPDRPKNLKPTLPFHVLYQDLFDPLISNLHKKNSTRPTGRRAGPHGGPSNKPQEIRKNIIERFISRWRREVGDDFLPAMRLIIPDKDRDRAMYGLKEKALARYLVKLMKIDKNSEDGFSLLNWKLPGQNAASRSAGDFAGRCSEILHKRAHLIEPGNMSVEEVNTQLDKLSTASKEEVQLPIMETFYKNMNAEEMTWLIRIITRSMKIGATERTILNVWHPDADTLFNVSSSLRRVCWDLWSPSIRLESGDRSVKLAECYLPQLAYQPKISFEQMVNSMKPTEDDDEFWIEEKLDGERMQLHVISDEAGRKKFIFWSRKSKDYTYLYGDSFEKKESALTQYVQDVFKDGVENAIFDGEMTTWDTDQDAIAPFGTLKTAALEQQKNSQFKWQPFYRIFDILLLNDQDLTRYTLRDRRKALEATINNVHCRMEILPYSIGRSAADIESKLREVVAKASEGLVLKNPRGPYMLNERYNDWVKVKPEYMAEFGESLDCLIIGGYYGTGHRGGALSSFLCGLREDVPGKKSTKFLSFFKVGGGMTSDDFAKLRHNTEGKWHKYDPSRPPTKYIVLGGGQKQIEKPDMWIKPEDSIVVEVKAASVNSSEDYAVNVTLRFPRFSKFRTDKDWQTALSVEEFTNIKLEAENQLEQKRKQDKMMEMGKRKQKTQTVSRKKQIIVAGYNDKNSKQPVFESPKGDVFEGLTFYIMTECSSPEKKSKIELEQMVKENGGKIVQSAEIKNKNKGETETDIVCVAERRTVKVASLEKRAKKSIVKPIWLFDCIKQARIDFAQGVSEMVVPMESDRHLFFIAPEHEDVFKGHVDRFGDSFARDTTVEELKSLMAAMGKLKVDSRSTIEKRDLLDMDNCLGWMFARLVLWFDDSTDSLDSDENGLRRIAAAKVTAQFAGAEIANDFEDQRITHVVLHSNSDKWRIRKEIAKRKKLPRIVSLDWIEECWKEHTRIDEERYAVV